MTMTNGELMELLQRDSLRSARRRGNQNPQFIGSRKLSDLQVQDILRNTENTAAELASFYDVSVQLIKNIRIRRSSHFSDRDNPGEPNLLLITEPYRSYHKGGKKQGKLLDRQVLQIKLTDIPLATLASEYHVSYGLVWHVRNTPYDPPNDSSDGDVLEFEVAGKRYYRRDLRALADDEFVLFELDGVRYDRPTLAAVTTA